MSHLQLHQASNKDFAPSWFRFGKIKPHAELHVVTEEGDWLCAIYRLACRRAFHVHAHIHQRRLYVIRVADNGSSCSWITEEEKSHGSYLSSREALANHAAAGLVASGVLHVYENHPYPLRYLHCRDIISCSMNLLSFGMTYKTMAHSLNFGTWGYEDTCIPHRTHTYQQRNKLRWWSALMIKFT